MGVPLTLGCVACHSGHRELSWYEVFDLQDPASDGYPKTHLIMDVYGGFPHCFMF